ncbi:MAG: endolytic transglycosylase MltG [Endomicrobiaceae bacterium]|nr:endolytic transglycosylase MltG [Endomicrobiaceae bacterium]
MVKQKIVKFIFIFFISLSLFSCSNGNKDIEIVFQKGLSPRGMANKLRDADLISSSNIFVAIVKLFGWSKELKAGRYEFNESDSIFKILSKIRKGESLNIKITIPEGFDIKKIADLLQEKGIGTSNNFVELAKKQNMEGFLLPETYFVDPTSTEKDIMKTMNDEFNKFWSPEFDERTKQLKMTQKDIIILASIVEKEAVSANERNIIAGIFYNRLYKKMRLESCSTVLYAMGINKERLTFEDLKFDSKYNTYQHSGLPPGPICNPGKETIKATLFPAITDYLYFVSKGDGTHLFATNLNEHVIQKQVTKKIIKKAKNGKKKSLS